ncbi:MAG: DEAD/DEAH box helicase [Eubacterium sp.]|nr:DEAD/DEAH box helicase [Eubacterium sp.]
MDIFERYAPFIQNFIYDNNWQSLRGIQVAAGDAIFNTEENVLLCASTASGKTEAAFFPILTEFWENPPASIGCIYIAPLKALINDQFIRLNDLCEEAEIPVWHWHGDVSASHKKRMMKHPSGILQITPESLEAMVMRRHSEIPRLFGDLRYVVIDEIHSLLRGDRGGQTLCLIERLSRLAGVNPRRIGLSATIGDPEAAGRFLSAGSGRDCVIPKIQAKGQEWRLSMEHFYLTPPQASEVDAKALAFTVGEPTEESESASDFRKNSAASKAGSRADESAPDMDYTESAKKNNSAAGAAVNTEEVGLVPGGAPFTEKTDKAPAAADPSMAYIFEHTRGKKCLVFSNSREECEAVTTTLRAYCEYNHEPDRFLIHHGNLSVSYRETAEEAMKDDDQYLTTCTTSTLELGIDIGKLERAFQIDAPFTVSSFLQRMGRTGRRGAPAEMWFVIREEHEEARALLPETIPWKLLQGIALVQLYLEERWVEGPRKGRLPYSLLYHQTMSTLASGGEMTPAELASRVLSLSYFQGISQDDFRVLLHHLIRIDHIQITENGGLIVGLSGERITNSFKFFAVFQENEEYHVRSESTEIGTIVKPPPIGDKIAIAGHVWTVEEVDRIHHMVYCHMVKGKVPAYFGDEPGDIQTKILERMRQALREQTAYPYLMKNASARLAAARESARLSDILDKALIPLGGNIYCLFPWLGSYAFLALERFLRLRCKDRLGLKGFNSVRPYYIQFSMKVTETDFFRILADEIGKPLDPMELVYPKEVPVFDKYDDILPAELVRKGFAYGVLDVEGMRTRILEWVRDYAPDYLALAEGRGNELPGSRKPALPDNNRRALPDKP